MLNSFRSLNTIADEIKKISFRELQPIKILFLVPNSYTSWSKWFISLKLCMGFSIFDSVSFLLYFVFFSTKIMDSLTLKRHNSFQNKNNRKTTHILLSDHWFLGCNKKFENSMISAWVGAPLKLAWRQTF